MKPEEIAAYLGAAAWLPLSLQWLFKFFAKPRARLMSSPTVYLGNFQFGPSVWITASLTTDRRDAIIEKVTLLTRHSRGETRSMTWRWLLPPPIELTTSTMMTMTMGSFQPAIAMKVPVSELSEVSIIFVDNTFVAESQARTSAVLEHFEFLCRSMDQVKAADELLRTEQFVKLHDFHCGNLPWSEGEYRFAVSLHVAGLRVPRSEYFSVTLSKADLEAFRDNAREYVNYFRSSHLAPTDGTGGYEKPKWNWRELKIERMSE